MPPASTRSRSRSAARLAAVQALYQREMEQTPVPQLLHEFHHHRLGATIEGVEYEDAEVDFFDDLVSGVAAREAELDGYVAARLTPDWPLHRLDRPMRQILRAGAYELAARIDVPTGSVISEYVDVAKAFTARRKRASSTGSWTPSRRTSASNRPPHRRWGGGPGEAWGNQRGLLQLPLHHTSCGPPPHASRREDE